MSNPEWRIAANRYLSSLSQPDQEKMLAIRTLITSLTAFREGTEWQDALWLLRTSGQKITLAEKIEGSFITKCVLDQTGFQIVLKATAEADDDSPFKSDGLGLPAPIPDFAEQIIGATPAGEREDLTMYRIHTGLDAIAAAAPVLAQT